MRVAYPNLNSEMSKRGLDYKDIADILGINEYAAYRRLRGIVGWKLQETLHLSQYFGADLAWLFECDVTARNI